LISRRTDAHLVTASTKRLERWCRIAFQAAEQSRRLAPPEIAAPTKLQDAAKIHGGLLIVLNESEQQQTLRELLAKRDGDATIVLAIGPEGGWTDDELQIFENQGWLSASLGTTILRSETAAIAAIAVTIAE
jgi:16S rRNA (uracil1498-N3)-methyltransferase